MACDLTGKKRERTCEMVGQGSWPTSAGSYRLQELSKERERCSRNQQSGRVQGKGGLAIRVKVMALGTLWNRETWRENRLCFCLVNPSPTGVLRGILVSVVDEKILNHISRKSFTYLTFSTSPDIFRACFAPSFTSTVSGQRHLAGKVG